MKTEIKLRKQAIALYLQGWKKCEIVRKLQQSRPWVDRWIDRYRAEAPTLSLEDRSRAPKHRRIGYAERLQRMVVKIREERAHGKRAKYQ
jgi:transposase